MNLIKKLLKRKLLTVTLVGFVLFAWITSYFIYNYIHLNNYVAQASQVKEDSDLLANQNPIRLKIPTINVDATIEYVGLDKLGAMGVPLGPDNVAWYNQGPHPGEVGSAVMDGHSGWKDGIPAVFDNLYKLKKGDKIYVENSKGEAKTFVVREIRTYDPEADASNIFNSTDGLAHLNLITCSGLWDDVAKNHSSRLVIFTDLEI